MGGGLLGTGSGSSARPRILACSVLVTALALLPAAGVEASSSSTVSAIAVGKYHNCALTSDGGIKCWGANAYGQLGDGTRTDRNAPVGVSGLQSGVGAIAAGRYDSCALTSAGGVKCWGGNGFGQLGDGSTSSRSTPVDVSSLQTGVTAIAAGGYNTCALTSAGGVRCWGYNQYGQLGDGTNTSRPTPVAVSGLQSGVTAIAAGLYQTCALTTNGGAKCWGLNGDGELGDGSTTDRASPVDVAGLQSGVVAVAGGDYHTCALTSAGAVKCWGANDRGQLGDGTIGLRTTPGGISGLQSGVTAIAAGGDHTCALTSAGAAKCWGDNYYGQLGDGTTAPRAAPVDVSGLQSGVTAIAAGPYDTCALTSAGGVMCWGDNEYGQLGAGCNQIECHTPVAVAFPGGFGHPPPTFCVVPKLVGKTVPAARRAILAAKCTIGRIEREYSAKPAGRVIAQFPRPKRAIAEGAHVDLVVSKGRKPHHP